MGTTETEDVQPDGTGLVILIPMLGRPHRIRPLLDSIEASTPRAQVLFLLSPADRTVRQTVEQEGRTFHEVHYRPVGDYARKINCGVRVTSAPWLFTAADDLRFHPGWFETALAMAQPGIGVIGTNDLGNPRVLAGEHATHFLVARWYTDLGTMDRPGELMCTDYPHEFVDDELVGTAKKRGMWAMALDAHVEHLHPNWGKAKIDALYQQQPARMRMGQTIYRRRIRLWS